MERTLAQLRGASALLDDLASALSVFDAKLRGIREDVGAIELSNNLLERQARNHGRLLDALSALFRDLRLPPALAAALEEPSFKPSSLPSTTKARGALGRLVGGRVRRERPWPRLLREGGGTAPVRPCARPSRSPRSTLFRPPRRNRHLR